MKPEVSSDLKPEWRELSDIIERARVQGPKGLSAEDLARLGPLYRMTVSDLALVRSRQTDGRLLSYLNDLIARGHGLIYTSPPSRLRQTLRFLLWGFPRLVRGEMPAIASSTAIFLAGVLLAFIVVWRDPSTQSAFVPAIFGGGGNMPPAGRSSGGPGIPDALKPAFSSFIMTNNITVSISTFASGVTFGILTVSLLLKNGMMLGGLAALFCKNGNGLVFWSLILPHGIIELAAICISGGAGLILAGALIRPGDLSRWESLKQAARRAVPLMAGVAAMLIVAGVIEGFLTPSKLSPQFKLAFAALTAALLAVYIVGAGAESG